MRTKLYIILMIVAFSIAVPHLLFFGFYLADIQPMSVWAVWYIIFMLVTSLSLGFIFMILAIQEYKIKEN